MSGVGYALIKQIPLIYIRKENAVEEPNIPDKLLQEKLINVERDQKGRFI